MFRFIFGFSEVHPVVFADRVQYQVLGKVL